MSTPCTQPTADPYFTDGLRAVFWVSSKPIALEDVEFGEWAKPFER